MGILESFYLSSWQQPFLLWGFLFLGWIVAWAMGWLYRVPESWMRIYASLFTLSAALDAGWTATQPFGVFLPLEGLAASVVPVFFVIVGDFRLYFWSELKVKLRQQVGKGLKLRTVFKSAISALGLCLIVPVFSFAIVKQVLAPQGEEMRWLFLIYELSFLAIWSVYWKWNRARFQPDSAWSWAMFLPFLFYSCWALADVGILFAPSWRDAAFGLRTFANLLYYGAWVPWILWGESSCQELKA